VQTLKSANNGRLLIILFPGYGLVIGKRVMIQDNLYSRFPEHVETIYQILYAPAGVMLSDSVDQVLYDPIPK